MFVSHLIASAALPQFGSAPSSIVEAPAPREGSHSVGARASSVLWSVLDEIDYGLLVVSPHGLLRHANHLARHELARQRFLRLDGDRVQSCSEDTAPLLDQGVRIAARGRRHMHTLKYGDDGLSIAFVPLTHPYADAPGDVLLMLSRILCTQGLALSFFSREHKLTPAEEDVLRGLCKGMDVSEIAQAHGVAESTIRTQVRSLRDKTRHDSIRALLQTVFALPPVVPALRHIPAMA